MEVIEPSLKNRNRSICITVPRHERVCRTCPAEVEDEFPWARTPLYMDVNLPNHVRKMNWPVLFFHIYIFLSACFLNDR